MPFQRSRTVAFSRNFLVGVTATVLLLSGCTPNNSATDDTRQPLLSIVDSYLKATTPLYSSNQALTSGEIPNLYSQPDEYRTVWMGYLTTTTGTDFVNDSQWQKTLDYLQTELREVVAGNAMPDRGSFVSGADRIDRIAGLIPAEKISQETRSLLSNLLTQQQQELNSDNTPMGIADQSLLLRASLKTGISGQDTSELKKKITASTIQGQARGGSIEAIRALTLAGQVLVSDPEISQLLKTELPIWATKISSTPLSAESAPVLYEIRALVAKLGITINSDVPGYGAGIVAFGKNWVGFAEATAPDPQLTFYWRSFGLLTGSLEWKNSSLPTGGWSQSVKPSLLGTATNQTLQEQFNGRSAGGEELNAQRDLIKTSVSNLANDISEVQSTSFLAAAARYQLTSAEQQKLTAAAIKSIQQALETKNYFQVATTTAILENFGIDPGSLKNQVKISISNPPQSTLTDQYALELSKKLFGQEDSSSPPDFAKFNVIAGKVTPENPQRLTDIALIAKLANWSDDEKYAALASFINTDTNQLCSFSDCRKASVSALDMLAASTLSKPSQGAITTPRIL